jgi:hypothetical protein
VLDFGRVVVARPQIGAVEVVCPDEI